MRFQALGHPVLQPRVQQGRVAGQDSQVAGLLRAIARGHSPQFYDEDCSGKPREGYHTSHM